MDSVFRTSSPEASGELASQLAPSFAAGDLVLLSGVLGSGKTTFVRGVLHSLGFQGPVRSPTFNLIQNYDVHPPVMHADLYRLDSAFGFGLEEYLDTHLCFVEWPERGNDLLKDRPCWRIRFEIAGEGREIHVLGPSDS